jgi:hypothetical protein
MAATLRWTREVGEGWVAAWQASGKSREAFARDSGIASHRLHYWVGCVAARTAEKAPTSVPAKVSVSASARPGFVELRPAVRAVSGVAVVCGKNIRVEVTVGFDAEVLRAVVAAFGAL